MIIANATSRIRTVLYTKLIADSVQHHLDSWLIEEVLRMNDTHAALIVCAWIDGPTSCYFTGKVSGKRKGRVSLAYKWMYCPMN